MPINNKLKKTRIKLTNTKENTRIHPWPNQRNQKLGRRSTVTIRMERSKYSGPKEEHL